MSKIVSAYSFDSDLILDSFTLGECCEEYYEKECEMNEDLNSLYDEQSNEENFKKSDFYIPKIQYSSLTSLVNLDEVIGF